MLSDQTPKSPGESHPRRRPGSDNDPTRPPVPEFAGDLPVALGSLAESIRQNEPSNSNETAKRVQQIVGDWTPEIRRHGLTAASIGRDRSAAEKLSLSNRRSSIARSFAESRYPEPAQARPDVLGKRPSGDVEGAEPPSQAAVIKRVRVGASSGLSLGTLPQTYIPVALPSGLVSPLFFSNTIRHMTGRPPSFSASEAAASMIGDEPSQRVTTLKLPKGQVSSASPARSSGTSGSWTSYENVRASRSPEGRPSPQFLQLLQGVGVIELLEQDERPTFVIDLANSDNYDPGPLYLVFANASLRASQSVSELLLQDTSDPSHTAEFSRFKAWLLSFVKNNESMDVCLPSLAYGGVNWTCSTLRRRFRFVSGSVAAVSVTPSPPSAQASSVLDERGRGPTPMRSGGTPGERSGGEFDYFGDVNASATPPGAPQIRSRSEPRSRAQSNLETAASHRNDDLMNEALPLEDLRLSFDWTRIPLDSQNVSSHIQFARSVDWSATGLGPLERWSPELRLTSNLIMGSPHPVAMYWGPEHIAIYNEAYIPVAGKKHPRLMGSRYRDAWAEIWNLVEAAFEGAWNAGQSTMKHDDQLFMTRNGYVEEVFFDWSLVPLVGADGSVVALYNPAFENTRRKVNERRMLTLREVGEKTSHARDVSSFWGEVKAGLEYNEFDVPFALIYSVTEDCESDVSSIQSSGTGSPPQISLEGSLGAPQNHRAAVPAIDLRTSEEGFAPYFRECMSHPTVPVVLSSEDGTLPTALIDGLTWRGFGDPCRTIVVFPVHPTTGGDAVIGFMVLGINPRRPYDDDYKLFVNLLARQLATSLASVVLFEEEIKRGQKAARLAALDRQELSLQLRLRTQEAVESEYRFTRMAEFAPVGMFIADGQGNINYCNDKWWDISKHPRSSKTNTVDNWMQSIRDEDRGGVEAVWNKLVKEGVAITHEFRFKGSCEVAEGHFVDTWALMSALPEKNEMGGLKSIFGCITDISQQKLAEDIQKQRRDEAVELKRQQENFIDITSHEMRNPLSAILQCADEISGNLAKFRAAGSAALGPETLDLLLDNSIDAASTIALCGNHQKRIVDDILTLSKLDSQLLMVTPVDVQPIRVVEKVLKMFESELKSHEIKGEFRIDQSYRELDVDWCKLDPSRLCQVLINLMTNAIKFTQGRETRSLTVNLGASKDASEYARSYFPSRRNEGKDITERADWGTGEKIYLHLAVNDTGPGLDEDEKKILFQRFSQASPRTHVQYGGSGLGLFICRILTELLGGQIGVTSEKGKGSTFAFYIRCRRVEDPKPEIDDMAPAAQMSPIKAREVSPPAQKPQRNAKSPPNKPQQSPQRRSSGVPPSPPQDPKAPRVPPFDVLIVEDNLVNQKVLQRQLRISGNNTHLANHGGEALEALQRSRFWSPDSSASSSPDTPSGQIDISVILMDLEMPVMDGMTCARKIRQLEQEGSLSCHIPIIAVTAYARPEQIADAKAAGIDDVISKPFRIPELIPKIKELVAKYNTSRPPQAVAA